MPGTTGSSSSVVVVVAAAGGFLLGAAAVASAFVVARRRVAKKDSTTTSKKQQTLVTSSSSERSITSSSLRGSGGSIRQVVSHGFLTDLIDRLWPHMKLAAGDMMKEILEESTADIPLLLHVTKMDLGNVPVRLDNIVIHQAKEDSSLQFDMDVVLDSNCDIQLKADYIGSFGVRDFCLQGRMSVLLKPLTATAMPCFTAIQYAFINPPVLSLNFTGLANIADFAYIDKSIRGMILETMQSMVVLPNRKLYKMDAANDFLRSYQPPVGVLRLTLMSGRGFVEEQRRLRKADVPDVYCNIRLGAESKVWRTSTIKDSLAPVWNETADFVVSDYEQEIVVQAWDQDNGVLDADDDLGVAKLSVGELLLSARKTMEVELIKDTAKECVPTGAFVKLGCEICPLTTNNMASIERADPNPNSLCGMLTILVTRAFQLPVKKEEAASYVEVTYGDRSSKDKDTADDERFGSVTSIVVDYPGLDALNPLYDAAFHIPLTPKLMSNVERNVIRLTLWNGTTMIGATQVTFFDLKNAVEHTITEERAMGTSGTLLEFQISLRAVQLPETSAETVASPTSTSSSMTRAAAPLESSPMIASPTARGAMGKVQVIIVKGHGFKIQPKKHLFAKPDVPDIYCKVRFGSRPDEWRTSTIRNSVLPFWNESRIFPLRDHGEVIRISVFDEDKNRTDDTLGQCRVTVGSVLLAGGVSEMQLLNKGQGTDTFLVVRCELLDDN